MQGECAEKEGEVTALVWAESLEADLDETCADKPAEVCSAVTARRLIVSSERTAQFSSSESDEGLSIGDEGMANPASGSDGE